MRRPQQVARRTLTPDERQELANRAVYKGSAEHKDAGWWCGRPAARQLPGGRVGRPGKQTTTICPLTTTEDRDRATQWVRDAIRLGQYKFVQADQVFPKRIWYAVDGQNWTGFCINTQLGHYKGWPISEEERRATFD